MNSRDLRRVNKKAKRERVRKQKREGQKKLQAQRQQSAHFKHNERRRAEGRYVQGLMDDLNG